MPASAQIKATAGELTNTVDVDAKLCADSYAAWSGAGVGDEAMLPVHALRADIHHGTELVTAPSSYSGNRGMLLR